MSEWAATRRVPATVRLGDGVTLEGELHVQARVAHHDGPEMPIEMLNRVESFFPLSLPDGGVAFVSKAQAAVVTCPPEAAQPDPDRASAAKRVDLHVILAGGDEVAGWASLELPPTRARSLDYLNAPDRFFALLTEDAAHYVNRAHVRYARPAD